MGIGFAIPINMAKNIYQQLIKTGKVVRGFLGVVIQDLTPTLARSFGLDRTRGGGALISEVMAGSPADRAGLKPGDVIVEMNGRPVEKIGPFRNRVARLRPRTKARVVVLRNGRSRSLVVKIGTLPGRDEDWAGAAEPRQTRERLGFSVQDLTGELARRLGYRDQTGVVVSEVEPGSPAAEAGIRTGALILEVNRQRIENTRQFHKAIRRARSGKKVLLLVRQGRMARYEILPLE